MSEGLGATGVEKDFGQERFELLRLLEALLFSSEHPLSEKDLARYLPEGTEVGKLLEELQGLYANRGIVLERAAHHWAFRTAPDLAERMVLRKVSQKKLSRAAIETLAVIAYHQPVTRAEIEEVRGVALSKGTLDTLLEAGWIAPRGRRRTPGKPLTWGTTPNFLDYFQLESLDDLPGVEELKAAGLLDTRPALAALGERGLLLADSEVEEDVEEEEDLLEEDFGDDLLSQEFQDGEDSPGRVEE